MPSARFRYIVRGYMRVWNGDPTGGWVQNVGYFKKFSDAEKFLRVLSPLIIVMQVLRVIVFKSGLAAARLERSRTRRRSLHVRDECGKVWQYHRPPRYLKFHPKFGWD